MADEPTDVFQFMTLRAGERTEPSASRIDFVRDAAFFNPHASLEVGPDVNDEIDPYADLGPGYHDIDIFSPQSPSAIGPAIYALLFGPAALDGTSEAAASQHRRRTAAIELAEQRLVAGFAYGFAQDPLPPSIDTVDLDAISTVVAGRRLAALAHRPSYMRGRTLHVLPSSPTDLATPLTRQLAIANNLFVAIASRPRKAGALLDFTTLADALASQFALASSPIPLVEWMFDERGRYNPSSFVTKRALFDNLYALYLQRKRERVSLDAAVTGLAVFQTLEAIAIAQYYRATIEIGGLPPTRQRLHTVLTATYPMLATWRPSTPSPLAVLDDAGVASFTTIDALARSLAAKPIIHPLFARLSNTLRPFNSLAPIGIGDLKVVKQKFLGYRKGEIAHIETILSGEKKVRVHRSLDRTEATFTLSRSADSDVTRDSQTTSRYELKNEAEEALKTDLGITAGASFTYKGNPVVEAGVTAGMTFALSKNASQKLAKSFVNEVVAKATSRVQSKVSQQRTSSRINEVEETNTHELANPAGDEDHISGQYLWLDKIYEGRIHNFGRRLMFELVLPEPAAFFVESRLYAYLQTLDVPRYPNASDPPSATGPTLPATAGEIDEDTYRDLALRFDLSAFPYPPPVVGPLSLTAEDGTPAFRIRTPFVITREPNLAQAYAATLANVPEGYELADATVVGAATFPEINEVGNPNLVNTLEITIAGAIVFTKIDETQRSWSSFGPTDTGVTYAAFPPSTPALAAVPVTIRDITCTQYTLQISVTLRRTAACFERWQRAVFDEVRRRTQASPAETSESESPLATYQRALRELRAAPLAEILRGTSGARNDITVARELKRQCIAMIAKEADSEQADDVLPTLPAIAMRELDVAFPVFDVLAPAEPNNPVREATVQFVDRPETPLPQFSTIAIDEAVARGRYVQFLEQAFEWEQLSQVFYPYFWARAPRWIELMSREDPADPLFTEFLQAGSAKVLLAVRPGYENAVLHFLATREAWEGGPAPVIGDPLYLPLYQEVHERQDDLAASTPEGEPWTFALPTSLVYLESERFPLVNPYLP